jgi:hypothetical protein
MTNIVSLLTQFDPHYQLQANKLEHEIRAKYDISRYNNESALSREHVRGGYAMDREQFKAGREDERLNQTINAQTTLEKFRGETTLGVARLHSENNITVEKMRGDNSKEIEHLRGETALTLSSAEHKNIIARMEEDLRSHITKSSFDSGVSSVHKLMDEDNKKRASLISQIEARSLLRGRITEKLIDAVIDVKVTRMKHDLEIKRMEKESELRRVDAYWNMLVSYLLALMNKGQEQEAKGEIDRLLEQWQAV